MKQFAGQVQVFSVAELATELPKCQSEIRQRAIDILMQTEAV